MSDPESSATQLTAIANPHARISLVPPTRESSAEEEDVPLLIQKGKGKKGADDDEPEVDPLSLPDPSLTQAAPNAKIPRTLSQRPAPLDLGHRTGIGHLGLFAITSPQLSGNGCPASLVNSVFGSNRST